MKQVKRILSLLLAVAMPLTVIAEDCAHNYPYGCSTLCTLCGEVRTPEWEHEHFLSDCDETCGLCGEVRETTVPHESDGFPCVDNVCKYCYADVPATTDHTDEDSDYYCDACWTWLGCDQGVHSRDGLPCQDAVCYYCGIEMPAEDHETGGAPICVDNQCVYCGALVPATADHNYQCYYEQEPTCVNDGQQYYECTQCYDRYTETIPTTGEHKDSDGDYQCDWCVLWLGCESGIHNRMNTTLCVDSVCSACGVAMPATEEHVSNNYACCDGWCVKMCDTFMPATADHTYIYPCDTYCSTCWQETNPSAEHSWETVTCDVSGDTKHLIDQACRYCGTAHSVEEEHVDENGDNACDVCGYQTCTHEYSYECSTNCHVCGEETRPEAIHVSNTPVCQDGRCTYCGIEVAAERDHGYMYECSASCLFCGAANPNPGDHVSSADFPCLEGDCLYCGAFVPAGDHLPDGHPCSNRQCGWCGEPLPTIADHTYDDDTDTACNVCGEAREVECAHRYNYDCSTACNLCGEETRPEAEHLPDNGTVYERVETHHAICYVCQYCTGVVDFKAEGHVDEDGDNACDVCDYTACAEHVYDSNFDPYCNVCQAYRDIDVPTDVLGVSVSEDVNGLAMLFSAKVEGVALDGYRIIYDNATIGGEKLIGLGVVVSNNYAETGKAPTLDDVDGFHVKDVPVVYAYDYDEATGTLAFAVRIINIPDKHKDTMLVYSLYFIYENDAGEQEVYYPGAWGETYNNVAGKQL